MRAKKGLMLLGTIIVLAVGSVLFIHYGNDHKECEDTTLTYKDADGNDVVEKQHICKEKFSF